MARLTDDHAQEGETKTLGLPYGSNPATLHVQYERGRAWQTASAIYHGPAFRGITRHGRISWRCGRIRTSISSMVISNRGADLIDAVLARTLDQAEAVLDACL